MKVHAFVYLIVYLLCHKDLKDLNVKDALDFKNNLEPSLTILKYISHLERRKFHEKTAILVDI